jgi:hypothetical protein
MRPFNRRHRWFVSGAALLVLAAVVGSRPARILLIEGARSARPLLAMRVETGDNLTLSFLHSVENCRVRDHLQIDDQDGLVLVATEFAESRTGLPYAAFEGEVFERRQDHFRISNMHRPIPEIYQWVDAQYENTLEINAEPAIRLASLAGNTLLHIRITRLTLAEWAWLKAKLFWQHRSF